MRLPRFLLAIVFITSFSLLYVYQQTEVFRLAYAGQEKQAVFEELLDKNNILRYNIKNSASLVTIGNRVSNIAEYEMPDTYRLVRLAPSQERPKQPDNGQTLLSRIFGIKRQAEAKPINPR
jgi:hypothetical protein